MITLISEAYISSANCLDELNYAWDQTNPLLIIYLENVSLPSGIAMLLGRLRALYRYHYDNPAAFYAKVVCSNGIGICGDGRFEDEEEEKEEDDSLSKTPSGSRKLNTGVMGNIRIFIRLFWFCLRLRWLLPPSCCCRDGQQSAYTPFLNGDSSYTKMLPTPDLE